MNAANEKLLGGGGIDKVIHNAAGTELRNECSRFPEKRPGIRCETGECFVTKGYKLHAKNVFHTVGPRNQKEDKLKECYESCLRNIVPNNIKSIAFCCIATGIFKFDRNKAAEIALSTTRNWIESNHVYIDRVIFCTYENDDFNKYKELMPTYFPVLNNHLTDNIDVITGNEYLTSATNVEISPELDDLSKLPMMNSPSSREKTPKKGRVKKSTSFRETPSKKKPVADRTIDIEFNTSPLLITNVRDPNNPLGLINEGVNVCFFNSVVQVLYSLPLFRNYIRQISPSNSIKRGIKDLFRDIENSNEPVRTSRCVQSWAS